MVIYLCFLSLVPPSPSYYRFTVDTTGFTFTLASLYYLHCFLKSRPIQERNILNSQSLLLVYVQLVFTVRAYLMSVAAVFLKDQMKTLLDTWPGTMNFIFDGRQYMTGLTAATCLIGLSQLMLISSLTTFQRIGRRSSFLMSTVAVVLCAMLDLGLNLVKCMAEQGHFVPFKHLNWLTLELGLYNYNYTTPLEDHQGEWNFTEPVDSINSENTEEKCIYFPVSQALILLTILTKLINIIVYILKNINKMKKKRMPLNSPSRNAENGILISNRLEHHYGQGTNQSTPLPATCQEQSAVNSPAPSIVNLPVQLLVNPSLPFESTATVVNPLIQLVLVVNPLIPLVTSQPLPPKPGKRLTAVTQEPQITEKVQPFANQLQSIAEEDQLTSEELQTIMEEDHLVELQTIKEEDNLTSEAIHTVMEDHLSSEELQTLTEEGHLISEELQPVTDGIQTSFNEEQTAEDESRSGVNTEVQEVELSDMITLSRRHSVSTKYRPVTSVVKNPSDILRTRITNELKFMLFKSGTVTLVVLIAGLTISLGILSQDTEQLQDNYFFMIILLIGRLFNYFIPVGFVLLDKDIRHYTVLRLRKSWNKQSQRFHYSYNDVFTQNR